MVYTQIKYIIAFTIFGVSESHWFLSMILFIGSLLVFVTYVYRRPFYMDRTQKVTINLKNNRDFLIHVV